MQQNEDAQFVVAYVHVGQAFAASAIGIMREFKAFRGCHFIWLRREGIDYSDQFVIFIMSDDPQQLLQLTASAEFCAFIASFDQIRIAPTIIKKFRSVVPASPDQAITICNALARLPAAYFSVTHLDVIPSIPGNVDRALALLVAEVRRVSSAQQQQQLVNAENSSCVMFLGLQQTDRANHFTLVQVLQHQSIE
jgi:hypothetical protein